MRNREVVRALLLAYRDQDRVAAEQLVATRFRFTSPQDDHIDRAAWFERCFPTADRFTQQHILELADVSADRVFLLYAYTLESGETYRNAEYSTVLDGQVTETQVYFGGRF